MQEFKKYGHKREYQHKILYSEEMLYVVMLPFFRVPVPRAPSQVRREAAVRQVPAAPRGAGGVRRHHLQRAAAARRERVRAAEQGGPCMDIREF